MPDTPARRRRRRSRRRCCRGRRGRRRGRARRRRGAASGCDGDGVTRDNEVRRARERLRAGLDCLQVLQTYGQYAHHARSNGRRVRASWTRPRSPQATLRAQGSAPARPAVGARGTRTEEHVQVRTKAVDVPIRGDERVHMPVRVRAGPERPRVPAELDARLDLRADGLDPERTCQGW
jgi:hypothetical protein